MDAKALGLGKPEKKHRARQSGAKADKKKDHKKKKLGLTTERHNPKAFSVANIGRTQKNIQRNLDRSQQKEVVPLVNRAEDLPPPTMVAVMGPSGVGKSTLIRSLVKLFTNQNMSDTKGPITCITGRKRRVTFFECPLDIYSLTDMSKVADLVVLMIDASYGFEMETFEYLNMLQLHGFPKVVGVLTHLDSFRANKTLQSTKKALKHRFWTEIYKGAKMFDFSGVINGKYLKHEVKRLSLYLMRVKYRPLVWRNTHPFIVVDRVDDITPVSRSNENPNCDRDVTLFGYVRGTHLKEGMRMHLIGAGDFYMASVTALPDPCPLPQSGEISGKASLKKKENLLYAPMANVGRVEITEKDGVYIDLKSINYTKKEHLQLGEAADSFPAFEDGGAKTPASLLRSMQDVTKGVDVLMHDAELSLFKGSKAVKSSDVATRNYTDEESDEDDDQDGSDGSDMDEDDDGDMAGSDEDEGDDEVNDEDDDEDEEEDDGELEDEFQGDDDYDVAGGTDYQASSNKRSADSWKEDMKTKAVESYRKRLADNAGNDLASLVYGKSWQKGNKTDADDNDFTVGDDADEDDGDELFVVKSTSSKQKKYGDNNLLDSNRFGVASTVVSERLMIWKEAFKGLSGDFSKLSFDRKASSLSSTHPLLTCNDNLKNSLLDIKNKFVTGDWGGAPKPGQHTTKKASKKGINSAEMDNQEDEPVEGLDDDEIYGDFEDLQTGEVFGKGGAKPKPTASSKRPRERLDDDDEDSEDDDDDDGGMEFEEGSDQDDDDDDDDDGDNGGIEYDSEENGAEEDDGEDSEASDEESDEGGSDAENDEIDRRLREAAASKKAAFKAKFDTSYDNKELEEDEGGDAKDKKTKGVPEEEYEEEKLMDIAKKLQEDRRERNKAEFGEEGELQRLRHEGYRQGLYVRIVIARVPAEFTRNFNPTLPVVLGGLQPFETELGYVTARVKRHRWHKGLLKSNDPIIFSIGWRRFQSIPVFFTEDQNQRERYLKYTPQHMHCMCSFYGPVVPPNSGVLAYQKSSRFDF
jgi:ribosome biogenesis protein BMS1